MRRCVSRAICILLLALSGVAAFSGDPAFLEVEGRLTVDPSRTGPAVLQIDRIYRFDRGKPVEAVGSLEVTCPSEALPAQMTVIGPGDSLTLNWTVLQKPKRTFGKKSKPGRSSLSVPEEGWAVRCGTGDSHRVYGLIVTEDGLASELVLEGNPGGFKSRLAMKKGSMPDPPERVRLRLAWTPLTPGPAAGTADVASATTAGS